MKLKLALFAPLLVWPTTFAGSEVDERDVLRLKNGKELRGRLFQTHGKDGVISLVKEKRRRFDPDEILSLVTVNDHLETIFDRFDTWPASIELSWTLAQWADSKGLTSMAEVLAYDIVLQDDTREAAHRRLGHRRRKDEWVWPIGSRFTSKKYFMEHGSKWGHPVDLKSEHFRVRTDAGLQRAVDALLDLERMYLFWMSELAEPLQLWEALERVVVEIREDMDTFPSVTGRKVPFYIQSLGDCANTFCIDADRVPAEFFTVASQAMVRRTVIGQSGKRRMCPWAEMGLSQWVQSHFRGSPGHCVPGKPVLDKTEVALVLEERPELKNATHQPYDTFLDVADEVPLRWAVTECFVHFLMEAPQPNLRDGFLDYFLEAHRGRGDSSSALDRALGQKVEKVETRFYLWLATL